MQTENSFVKTALERCGAFKTGHFELSSGRHSAHYVQCAQFCKIPYYNRKAGFAISNLVKTKPDLVISPAIGGIVIGYEVASQLELPFIFAEREKGAGPLKLRRSFEIKPGANVLIVEDVITTGKSVLEVASLVKDNKANVVSVACIIDRTNGQFDLRAEFISLLKIESESYLAEGCPLCQNNVEITKPGSRFA